MDSPMLTAFSQEAWAVILALLGFVVGSFLNVVIYRLPRMIDIELRQECAHLYGSGAHVDNTASVPIRYNLWFPGSQCPHCQHRLRAWENIPIVSYLLQKGRCRHCHAAISLSYPLVESLCAVLSLAFGLMAGFPSVLSLSALLLVWFLIALTFIDLDHYLIPDCLTLPLLWIGLIVNVRGMFSPLADAVFGAVTGYLILWIIYHLFKLVTGKVGIGYGDFKLVAALGAWFGWSALPILLVMASMAAIVIGGGVLYLRKQAFGHPIAFGPYLALAGAIVLALYLLRPPWLAPFFLRYS